MLDEIIAVVSDTAGIVAGISDLVNKQSEILKELTDVVFSLRNDVDKLIENSGGGK